MSDLPLSLCSTRRVDPARTLFERLSPVASKQLLGVIWPDKKFQASFINSENKTGIERQFIHKVSLYKIGKNFIAEFDTTSKLSNNWKTHKITSYLFDREGNFKNISVSVPAHKTCYETNEDLSAMSLSKFEMLNFVNLLQQGKGLKSFEPQRNFMLAFQSFR